MSIFVSKEPVAVSVDGENTIWIRPKMGYGTEQKVIGAAAKFEPGKATNGTAESVQGTVEVNIGAYNLALLQNNILRWEGPEFGVIPCTPENIALLDDDDPLVEAVLKEIADRNLSRPVEDKQDGAGLLIEGEYTEAGASPNSPQSRNGGSTNSQARTKETQAASTSTSAS